MKVIKDHAVGLATGDPGRWAFDRPTATSRSIAWRTTALTLAPTEGQTLWNVDVQQAVPLEILDTDVVVLGPLVGGLWKPRVGGAQKWDDCDGLNSDCRRQAFQGCSFDIADKGILNTPMGGVQEALQLSIVENVA